MMPSYVVAYGFLGRWPGSTKSRRYVMPAAAPSFRLRQLFAWPAPFSSEELLTSIRTYDRRREQWLEHVETPRRLSRYVPGVVDPEVAFRIAAPVPVRAVPGEFDVFDGQTPVCWHRWTNAPEVEAEIWGVPRGRVSVGWSGELRGLLLVGTEE